MSDSHPNKQLIALGVRQPWAELILRGIKTIEVRSQGTQRRGTIYLYSSKKLSDLPAAAVAAEKYGIDPETLPMGRLVGTVEILDSTIAEPAHTGKACVPPEVLVDQFAWHLRNPQRLDEPLAVRFLPYGVWFYPFRRKNAPNAKT